MSSNIKSQKLVEENDSIKPEKKENVEKKDKDKIKDKNLPLIRQSDTDKKDIIIELSHHHKNDEDEKSNNSAEFSGQDLKTEKKIEKNEEVPKVKPIVLSQKAYDKYTQRLKERTMRLEIEKIDKETERMKQKYEERNSYFHFFNNNPQFQKMINIVQKQLLLNFVLALYICLFNGLIYFYITRRKEGIALASFILAVAIIAIFIILFISLKLGLLNDPELSKAFRLFVIFEFLTLIASLVLNIILPFLIQEKLSDQIVRIIIYILFAIMALLFFITFKFSFSLYFESILILLNKKTEYSILIINEQNSPSLHMNLSLSNNVSSDNLNSTTTGMFNDPQKENNNKNKVPMTKEDERYRNFNYFNRFHYSVTSARNDAYILKTKP